MPVFLRASKLDFPGTQNELPRGAGHLTENENICKRTGDGKIKRGWKLKKFWLRRKNGKARAFMVLRTSRPAKTDAGNTKHNINDGEKLCRVVFLRVPLPFSHWLKLALDTQNQLLFQFSINFHATQMFTYYYYV